MAKKRSRRRGKSRSSLQSKLLLVLPGLLVLGLIAFGLFRPNGAEVVIDESGQLIVAAEVGALAPDFELPTMEGKLQKLSDYRGKPVVLTFMHTW